MAWSTSWANRALSSWRNPVYVLRVLSDGAEPAWSSHPLAGAEVALDPLGCSIQWGNTGPHRWRQPVSSARFALLASTSMEGVYQGAIVQLSIVLGGEEEPVWVGSLQNASRSLTGPLVLQCVGMEGALWSRMIELGASGFERRFFGETDPAAGTYAVAVDYTAGGSTIELAGSPTLRRRTGGLYCIKVTPNSGAGFYITGSSWVGSTLTIDTAGALDTTDANADAGNTVTVVAYDAGHPASLASRALSANSAWPDEWSMGLPGSVWDATEASAQATASGLTTAEQEAFVWAAEQPMERIGDVLGPLLSNAGVVLCQYQGRITARLIPSPINISAGSAPLFTRADIVENGAEWTAWAVTPQALSFRTYDRTKRDPLPITTAEDITTPYGALVYAHSLLGLEAPPPPTASGATATNDALAGDSLLRGQPVQDVIEVRLPIYGSALNRSAAREHVHDRLRLYSNDRPERLRVTLRGWHPHAIGDAIRVQLGQLPCRGSGPGGITTGHPAVIVGGGPDFFGATTTYDLLCIPTNTDT